MNNADMPAMPSSNEMWMDGTDPSKGVFDPTGLTKREYFAAMAMQGLAASGEHCAPNVANQAVIMADALLNELEK